MSFKSEIQESLNQFFENEDVSNHIENVSNVELYNDEELGKLTVTLEFKDASPKLEVICDFICEDEEESCVFNVVVSSNAFAPKSRWKSVALFMVQQNRSSLNSWQMDDDGEIHLELSTTCYNKAVPSTELFSQWVYGTVNAFIKGMVALERIIIYQMEADEAIAWLDAQKSDEN